MWGSSLQRPGKSAEQPLQHIRQYETWPLLHSRSPRKGCHTVLVAKRLRQRADLCLEFGQFPLVPVGEPARDIWAGVRASAGHLVEGICVDVRLPAEERGDLLIAGEVEVFQALDAAVRRRQSVELFEDGAVAGLPEPAQFSNLC